MEVVQSYKDSERQVTSGASAATSFDCPADPVVESSVGGKYSGMSFLNGSSQVSILLSQ
jgi:hypothetical protein